VLRLPLLLLLFFGIACFAHTEDYTAQVLRIPDGDTILVEHNGKGLWIRLNGVNCPENYEPYSDIALQTAVELFKGKTLTIRPYHLDPHHRMIADVFLPDGSLANIPLVRSGHCRWSHRYK
jgi:endonuclease YncB( thermonuclease family)